MTIKKYLQNNYKHTKYYFLFIVLLMQFNILHSETPFAGTVSQLNNPAPGYVRYDAYYMLNLDNYGKIQNLDTISTTKSNMYINLNNGSILELAFTKMYVYNTKFKLIDSMPYHPVYKVDFHSALVLKNGHYLLLCDETNVVDLSSFGGFTNAKVTTSVFVETDRTGTVYWSWRSKDYLGITQATDEVDLTLEYVRFTHTNSMFEDSDGNIVFSSRNLDEVIKVNKSTNAIMWRIGGSASKSNQYTFVNDTINGFYGFSHQHCATMLANGNLLLFDNGNLKPVQYSRVVEYQLNHTAKTATKVWELLDSPSSFAIAMGSAFRLPNGNTIINWTDRIEEVGSDYSVKYMMKLDNNKTIYRAIKVIGQMDAVSLNITKKGIYSFIDTTYNTDLKLNITDLTGTSLSSVEKHYYAPPINSKFSDSIISGVLPYRWVISNNGLSNVKAKLYINIKNLTGISNPNGIAIFYRKNETSGYFYHLRTSYDSLTNEISANITEFGEFCIGIVNKTVTPQLIYPKNEQFSIGKSVDLLWDKQYISAKYQLHISLFEDFSEIDSNLFFTDITTKKLNNLASNEKYFWRVRAINAKDTSKWSATFYFSTSLPAPELIAPTNNAININKKDTFLWSSDPEIIKYWFQVARDTNFTDFVYVNSKLGDTDIVLNVLLNNSKYFWRVKAYSQNDSSQWSKIFSFKTNFEKPILKSPENYSIRQDISGTLNWNSVEGATNYFVQVSEDTLFKKIVSESNKVNYKFYNYNDLEYGKDYYWRVKVFKNAEDDNWSEIWKFSTIMQDPVNIMPQNNSNIDSSNISFTWAKSQNAIMYLFQLSENEDFTSIAKELNNDTTCEKIISELPNNSVFYWRIKAYNLSDSSNYSAPFKFTTSTKTSDILVNITCKFDLYYNHFKNCINLKIEQTNKQNAITIYDVYGRLVFDKTFSELNNLEINLENNPKGIYLIRVNNEGKLFLVW